MQFLKQPGSPDQLGAIRHKKEHLKREIYLMARLRPRHSKAGKTRSKAQVVPMSDHRRLEVAVQFTDDVLSKLAGAFFAVVQHEGWGKRDLSLISGINETAIGHILAGRRKNLTVETIALLTRAMQTRPELVLHDLRPRDNNVARFDAQPLPLRRYRKVKCSSQIDRAPSKQLQVRRAQHIQIPPYASLRHSHNEFSRHRSLPHHLSYASAQT